MEVLKILMTIKAFLNARVYAIDWKSSSHGIWAIGCDFHENNLKNEISKGEDCSEKCLKTSGCTHYSWNSYNGGTCWMKKGRISKEKAFNAYGVVCGINNNSGNGESSGDQGSSTTGIAQLTWYESYARCCKSNPNYDPTVSTIECDFSYPGWFAGYSNQKSLSWVKSNNIISFFDSSDPNGVNWATKYARKTIRLKKNGKTFTAIIADTCGDHDCNGCCTKNAQNGFLVDMEYYTVLKNLGNLNAATGNIEFEIL
ncbi:fibroblast growth factor receptor-like [Brachionus plicatilis]|uniref:Fibroblast growth factor receptor-like n=1 Tax=Brachionus plicatilis TaxID=10195 RepID=A0A3M7QWT5_BRAPC|nr:fibroblast growth factor receptor-like [Brachionus plicatilis]